MGYGDTWKDFLLLFSLRHIMEAWLQIGFSQMAPLETPHISLHQEIPKGAGGRRWKDGEGKDTATYMWQVLIDEC